MALRPSKFKLDEELSLAGKPMRVAGRLQLEGEDAKIATRYLVADPAGAAQILEESGEKFTLLRAFPPAAQPQAAGKTVTVMGTKYALSGVRKLKVLGAEGQAPVAAPGAQLFLSGVFESPSGTLLRELVPGTSVQTFFGVKPVAADEVLGAEQLAALQEAQRLAAEEQAEVQAESEEAESGGPLKKVAGWIVTILVIGGLVYACSGPGEEEESSGGGRARFSWDSGGGK